MMRKFYLQIFVVFLLSTAHSRGFGPGTITVDRNWNIPEATKVGTLVKTVEVKGVNRNVTYALENDDMLSKDLDNPFWINPNNGYVYLNKSLEGWSQPNPFIISVAADDGSIPVKNQVLVRIVPTNGPQILNSFEPPHKAFPVLPDFTSLPQPPIPFPNGQPIFRPQSPSRRPQPDINVAIRQNKTYVDGSTIEPPTEATTKTTTTTTTTSVPTTTTTEAAKTKIEKDSDNLTALVTILIAVLTIFLVAALIGVLIFRKQLMRPFSRKFKKSKVDKAKKSNQSIHVITLSDESSRNSMVMQHWQGPLAYNNRYTPWSHDDIHGQISNSSFTYSGGGDIKVPGYDRWEFPRHRLKVFNILGEGAFGQVWRCEASDIDGVEGISTVAVKTLKENATEVEKKDLMSELQVMKTLETHVNVVRLLGCCTEKDPIFVIIEYVALGKLQQFLRNSRVEKNYHNSNGKSKTLTSRDLVSFMYQVARGMEFLSSRGIIHRDLAARNILITEDYTCKIADFGFARDIETSTVYERKTGGRQPIRWMAIESLYDNIFSVKSDVWAFGILMWEIATLGSTPYPGMGAAEVMKKVRDGYRLEKPEHTSREIYNYMYYCWDGDPKNRPDFSEIRSNLDKLLSTSTDYIELERFPEHDYYNILHNISGEKL
ncbi:tyrosine kinase receptor Cad96Ca [Chironomus tepperi]|uniref:tyrosine kinase receptor Cad96Ca n=1 Tax=Chironomus tepperi TaxID=113505 RepID=UPI00391F8181